MTSIDSILSGAAMNRLFAIQKTSRALATTQTRLATGKKVNSALDDPINFFSAQSLRISASNAERILDSIGQSIQTIKTAQRGLEGVSRLLEQTEATLQEAKAGTDFGIPSISSEVLVDSPVAYWRLNESGGTTATNLGSAGAAVNGTYQNGVTLGEPSLLPGGTETSADFDGTNQFISVPDSTAINLTFPTISQRTIELTFQADDTTTRQVLYEEGGNGPNPGNPGFAIYIESDTLYFHVDGVTYTSTVSTSIIAGQAYHAAFVLDQPAGEFKGYLNGNLVGTDTVSAPVLFRPGDIGIGGANDGVSFHDGVVGGSGFYFDGNISDVAVFNSALSDNRIQAHAAATGLEASSGNASTILTTLAQLDLLIQDSSYRGINILESDTLTTYFNEDRSKFLNVEGANFSVENFQLNAISLASVAGIDDAIAKVRSALEEVRSYEKSLGSNINLLQIRAEHAQSKAIIAREGADKLTLADTNEESAKILALQTQQQIQISALNFSTTGLSIASLLNVFV